MKNHIRIIGILLILGAALLGMTCIRSMLRRRAAKPGGEIVAKVNDENITISMIEAENLEIMAGRLAGFIIQKIAVLEARSKGLVVPEKEIKAVFNNGLAPDRSPEILEATQEYISELKSAVDALGRWMENPGEDEKIFRELQKKFPEGVMRADWEWLKKEHGKTAKAFAEYKQSINRVIPILQSKEKMYEVHSGHIRDNLLYQKLFNSMPTRIADEDRDKFLEFLKKQNVGQAGLGMLSETERKELQRQYNFRKYIRSVLPKYEIVIFDRNLRKKVYESLGL